MNQQAERRVGTIIGGKWRVDALLGSGSMAAVYGVTHRNGARAALKILHPTLCTDPAVCERFLGEGYLANSVKHSGIVRVLDDGVTDDGCVFLTMDLLEGDTLEALRQKRGNKIPIVETLALADKLMDILSAVHAAGIIHRDLKPQNVFVCTDGLVKLLDFGVARVFDRTSQSKLSMFGLVLGTPSFMSPEQALGSRDKVDHRSDIWSLAATIFTALTGETVHLGANVQAKLLAAATVKARSIAMVMPSLPSGLAAAIDMALRFKKEDRWQSVDAMRRAFREARENAGLGSSPEPVREVVVARQDTPSMAPTPLLSEPPEGPSGTFIGIGDARGKIASSVGNDGSVPPPPATQRLTGPPGAVVPSNVPPAANAARPSGTPAMSFPPPTPSTPGDDSASRLSASGAAARGSMPSVAPHPAAVVRRIPASDAGKMSRPDVQEGSIPAYGYGNTLNSGAEDSYDEFDARQFQVRPKGTVAVWLMAVLLAAAVLGGIAFFAVKRGSFSQPTTGSGLVEGGAQEGTPAPTPSSTSTSPATAAHPSPPPAKTSVILTPLDTQPSGKDAAAGTQATPFLTPPPARPGSGFPWKPAVTTPTVPPPALPPPRPTQRPTPTSEPPRPPPPGLAPDPFGTPD